MAEAQMTTEEFAAEYKKGIDHGPGAEPTPESKSPSFEAFSKARKEGLTGHEPQPEPVAPAPPARDDQGRFAKVRESLAKSQREVAYIDAMQRGAIPPDDSMDTSTWIKAREAQIRNATNGITPPDFGPDHPPTDGAAKPASETGEQLSPEETEHFQKYETFMSDLVAKRAIDPETKSALQGFGKAIDAGIPHDAMAVLGHVISDTENPHEVLLALGKDPSAIQVFSQLSPQGMSQAVQALSKQIAALKIANQPAPKVPKPAPPTPVGARAAASAFDVNDEKLSTDEWTKQRWNQVNEKRRR